MTPERLASFADWAMCPDAETRLFTPGLATPPLVCGSIARATGGVVSARFCTADEWLDAVIAALEDPRYVLVNLNIAFDLRVAALEGQVRRGRDLLPLIFDAYRQGRIFDPGIAEALDAIAGGYLLHSRKPPHSRLRDPVTNEEAGYRLSVVVQEVLGRADAKQHDRWRKSYALLEGLPHELWPPDATQYPIDDTINALTSALVQVGILPGAENHAWTRDVTGGDTCPHCSARWLPGGDPPPPPCPAPRARRNLHDVARQVYADWCLQLGAAWGLRTDRLATDALEAAASGGDDSRWIAAGFVRDDGTGDKAAVAAAVAKAYGAVGECPDGCDAGRIFKTGKKGQRLSSSTACKRCCGTGLDLSTAPIPMNDPTPTNPHGSIQAGRDTLIESGSELLMEYGYSKEDDKITETYVPLLRRGHDQPLTLRPNVLVDTGRTSYSEGIQTFPRQVSARLAAKIRAAGAVLDGGFPLIGVRDCFVPRDSWVYYSDDYEGGELVTHAESCFRLVGHSVMGRALKAGINVHGQLGASLMGVAYETLMEMRKSKDPAVKKRANGFRQAAKPANFGFPGGMGAARLVLQSRKDSVDTPHEEGPTQVWDGKDFVPGYKGIRFCLLVGGARQCGTIKVTEWKKRPYPPTCKACIEVAEWIRETWFKTWPENREYLGQSGQGPVNAAIEGPGFIAHHWSGRIRHASEFCSTANGWFQGYLADVAKEAQCRVSHEQYVRQRVVSGPHARGPSRFEGAESPLFGNSRSITFQHDELFGEARADLAAECSERVAEIMIETFREACPNHAEACNAEPTIMPRWWKGAEPRRDESGRLVCWTP